MKEMEYLEELTGRYPVLEAVKEDIRVAYELSKDCYERGGEVLVAGNGRSCADSEHIVGEFMEGFVKRHPMSPEFAHALRQADPQRGTALAEGLQEVLPAIVFTGYTALSTAFLNDVDGEIIYVQQLYSYGEKGDVFIGVSTSGNVKNMTHAAAVAKTMGIKVIGLAGRGGGALAKVSDAPIMVLEGETFKIQELRPPVHHAPCLMLKEHLYEA